MEIKVIGQRQFRKGLISLCSEETFVVNLPDKKTFHKGAYLRGVTVSTYNSMTSPKRVELIIKDFKPFFAPVVR